ncbi:amidohydrolase family protein [Novosphingobium sp. KCTC 2891]|uniref:amidohydrolase family protein n=1 Tax=Novosphingobium sp. KCTC 2891 TaxID=2989730 RepID=UPI002222A0B3|nr:amidohydrolase family protein [Novosphingobium sp. KCTC 2891]MCW1384885.1 amidohydrolase family protein [Novosphingobium sp. KCTC 2891]
MTVAVEGERIVEVAPDSEALRGAEGEHVDLGGKTLMPGMTQGHWHPDYGGLRLADVGKLYLGTQSPPSYLAAVCVENLNYAIQSGVTNVVGAACSFDNDVAMKMAIADGRIPGPRIRPSGLHINSSGNENEPNSFWLPAPPREDGMQIIGQELYADGVEGMRKAVRHQLRRKVEVIKIFPSGGHGIDYPEDMRSMTRDELATVIETAHDHGAIVRGHVTTKRHMLEAVELGMDIVDHGDGMDDEVIEAMVKHGTHYVPSMLFLKKLMPSGEGDLARSTQLQPVVRSFENLREMLPRIHAAGINIVPGDDFGLEFMMHGYGNYAEELEVYVNDCNIAARDVLTWATRNGAKMMGLGNDGGLIQKGRLADLIVVDGDPLADIGILRRPLETLDLVMVGGKTYKDRLARV